MPQPARRRSALVALLALLLITLSGCLSDTNGSTQKATATTGPRATSTSRPGGTPTSGGTPSTTSTPLTACGGALSDIVLPDHAVQVGATTTSSATTNCDYQVPQDLKTLDTFFRTQMPKTGWRLLHDDAEGPLAMTQQYFKAQRFATITLSQHGSDVHTTDITITVEASQ